MLLRLPVCWWLMAPPYFPFLIKSHQVGFPSQATFLPALRGADAISPVPAQATAGVRGCWTLQRLKGGSGTRSAEKLLLPVPRSARSKETWGGQDLTGSL